MWIDRGLYWAWQGGPEGFGQPPHEKALEYAALPDGARIVCAVTENGVRREVHAGEIATRRGGSICTA